MDSTPGKTKKSTLLVRITSNQNLYSSLVLYYSDSWFGMTFLDMNTCKILSRDDRAIYGYRRLNLPMFDLNSYLSEFNFHCSPQKEQKESNLRVRQKFEVDIFKHFYSLSSTLHEISPSPPYITTAAFSFLFNTAATASRNYAGIRDGMGEFMPFSELNSVHQTLKRLPYMAFLESSNFFKCPHFPVPSLLWVSRGYEGTKGPNAHHRAQPF